LIYLLVSIYQLPPPCRAGIIIIIAIITAITRITAIDLTLLLIPFLNIEELCPIANIRIEFSISKKIFSFV
jgi:hypothetical protein